MQSLKNCSAINPANVQESAGNWEFTVYDMQGSRCIQVYDIQGYDIQGSNVVKLNVVKLKDVKLNDV